MKGKFINKQKQKINYQDIEEDLNDFEDNSSFEGEEYEDDDDIPEEADNNSQEEDADSDQDDDEDHSDSDSEAIIYENAEKNEEAADNNDEEAKEITEDDKTLYKNTLLSICSNLDEFDKKNSVILKNFKENKIEIKYGLSYMEAKQHIFIIYLEYLMYYDMLKLQGESIKNHPILKKLIFYRNLLERMKVVDLKLKPQIDRLLKLSEQDENQNKVDDVSNSYNNQQFKPQILDMDISDNEEEMEENRNEQEKESKKLKKAQQKYKIKKNIQEFYETNEDNKKRQKKINKMKDKIRNSEFYNDLKDEFSENPKEFTHHNTEYDKYMAEVENYENENFVRMTISKKELKQLKKKDRKKDDFSTFGNEYKHFDKVLNEDDNEAMFGNKKLNMSFGGGKKNHHHTKGKGKPNKFLNKKRK